MIGPFCEQATRILGVASADPIEAMFRQMTERDEAVQTLPEPDRAQLVARIETLVVTLQDARTGNAQNGWSLTTGSWTSCPQCAVLTTSLAGVSSRSGRHDRRRTGVNTTNPDTMGTSNTRRCPLRMGRSNASPGLKRWQSKPRGSTTARARLGQG